MQCPKCRYEPTMAEAVESPERCPSCGVYYAKVSAGSTRQPQRASTASKRGSFRLTADPVDVALRGLDGVHPVVVVDVQMRFTSMVKFMVMWAIASVPAVLILLVFGAIGFAVLGAMF